MRASAERHQEEIEELNNLNSFVAERSTWLQENEEELIDNMQNTVETIKKMRQYPKEKDVVLGYLEKKTDYKPARTP